MKKLVLAFAVTLAGCNALTDSNTLGFNYTLQPLDQAPATPAPASVNDDNPGLIRISGDISTPCADQGAKLTASRKGSELRVSVEQLSGAGCSGGVRWYSYDALLSVPVGATYHLLMTNNAGGSPVTVVDQQVTVKG